MTWVEGELFARGATADVFRGVPGTVVKVFHSGFPAALVREEAAGAAFAAAAGLPTPALLSADPDGGRLTFAYAPGTTLASASLRLGARRTGELLALLLADVSEVRREADARGGGKDALPTVHERLAAQISSAEAPESLRTSALAELASLPAGDRLLHLDLHLLNVLWDGKPAIIDWSNTAWGPASADVARTRLLLQHSHFYVPRIARGVVRVHLRRTLAAFEESTRRRSPQAWTDSWDWARVFAAARLDGPVAEVEKAAIRAAWS